PRTPPLHGCAHRSHDTTSRRTARRRPAPRLGRADTLLARRDFVCGTAMLAVAAHFAVVGLVQPLVRPYVYSDFVTFDAAARCFARGLDPYDDAALRTATPAEWRGWVGGYYYPPPFAAAIVRPLAALPFETSRRLWVLLECAAFTAAALGLAA